jgi:hypothetical protein
MPVAAARLADVGARNPQPLVVGGRGQHAAQELAVAGLQLPLLPERHPRCGDPLGQRVPYPLQLLQAGYPRLREMPGDGGLKGEPRKCLNSKAGELVLETGDLAPQLGAREALVASHSKRRERVSIEQIRHKNEPSVNHGPTAENEKLVKEIGAGVFRRRSPHRRSRAPRQPPPGERP